MVTDMATLLSKWFQTTNWTMVIQNSLFRVQTSGCLVTAGICFQPEDNLKVEL